MTVRAPQRPPFLEAALSAWNKVRALVVQLIAKKDRPQATALPSPTARPSAPLPAGSAFATVAPSRPPVSLGESPTSAAEKPREGADAVKHVGEQAVVGSQRARQLLLDVQRAPPSNQDRPRSADANAPKAKIPPGPFRP